MRAGADALPVEAPFSYSESPPPGAIRAGALCRWSARVTSDGPYVLRLVPDGCVELVFPRDGPALVYGPRDEWIDVVLPPGAEHSGIRLRAGAAAALLRVDATELAGATIELRALGSVPSEATLAERVADLDPLAVAAAAALDRDPRLAGRRLSRLVDVSDRQLRRRFARAVGMSPSAYARVARARNAVRLALERPDSSWARIAAETGFSDQAHLTRELVRRTGHTPTALGGRRGGR